MKIIVNNRNKKIPKDLLKACNDNEILAKILYNRGIRSVDSLKKCMDYRNYIPYDSLDFPPMKNACKMI